MAPAAYTAVSYTHLLPYINEPVKANFEAFVYEAELINANITSAINSLKMKIPNRVFHEWLSLIHIWLIYYN